MTGIPSNGKSGITPNMKRPFICTLLISATGSSLAPGYYLMMVGLLSVWALFKAQRTQR